MTDWTRNLQHGRPNKNLVLQLMRDDDFADPWGTGMAWLGAVCDVVYDADPNLVPAVVEYRPGMGGPEVPNGYAEPHRITLKDVSFATSELWCYAHNMDPNNEVDADDLPYWSDPTFTHRIDVLVEAANLLHRYLNWCRAAGRDY